MINLLSSIFTCSLFFTLCFIVGYPFLKEKIEEANSLAVIILATFFGGIILTLFSVLLRIIHLPIYTLLIVPLIIAIAYRKSLKNVQFNIANRKIFIHLILLVFLNVNLFIQGIRMGFGDYASEFYNVDSAAYLGLLQGYLKSNTFPPINLEILGASFKYHYGVISFAAIITTLTSVKAHQAFFIVIPIFCAVTFYSIVYLIAKKILNALNFWKLILTTSIMIVLINFEFNTTIPLRFYNFIFKIGTWGKQFPMLSSFMANCLIVFSVYILLCMKKVKDSFLLLIIIPFLAFTKLPYLPITLSIVSLYLLFYKKYLYIYWLLPLLVILSLSSIFFLSFGNNMSNVANKVTNTIHIGFFKEYSSSILLIYSAFLFPLMLVFFQAKKIINHQIILLVLVVFVPILMSTLLKIDNPDYFQFFSIVNLFLIILLIPITISIFHQQKLVVKGLVLFNFGFIIIVTCTSLFYYTYLLLKKRDQAHEYANNISIAEALKQIPVNNTLLVTNDLRYPANNYQRENKQFQLSAIWGHQCLASSKYFITKESEDNFIKGIKINQLLQQSNWSDSLTNLLSQKNVTHLLIHREYNHCNNIPFNKIYESNNYQVYSLK
ncbi:MAG: hypothetical protein KBF36_03325 [Chitinophagaceae bacterium]|nr:hypothetical protein [Chitinophagaceae bacterium]